jgi:hypothetical protein
MHNTYRVPSLFRANTATAVTFTALQKRGIILLG